MINVDDSPRSLLSRIVGYLFPLPKTMQVQRGTWEYHRARALSALLITLVISGLLVSVVLLVLHAQSDNAYTENLYATLAGTVLIGLQLWLFFSLANLRLSAMLFVISYFLMIAAIVITSGAYDSPYKVALLSSPVIAFRVGGREEGIVNGCFVAVVAVILVFIHQTGFTLENHLDDINDIYSELLAWIITLLIIVTCMAAYDTD